MLKIQQEKEKRKRRKEGKCSNKEISFHILSHLTQKRFDESHVFDVKMQLSVN